MMRGLIIFLKSGEEQFTALTKFLAMTDHEN